MRLADAAETITGVAATAIMGRRRSARIALVRQYLMFITREGRRCGLQETAEAYNRGHHATVIHAVKLVRKMLALEAKEERQPVRRVIEAICQRAEHPTPSL